MSFAVVAGHACSYIERRTRSSMEHARSSVCINMHSRRTRRMRSSARSVCVCSGPWRIATRRLHATIQAAGRCSGPQDDPPAAAAAAPGRLDVPERHLVNLDWQVAVGGEGPTRRPGADTATASVSEGTSDTTRRAGAGSSTGCPRSSRHTVTRSFSPRGPGSHVTPVLATWLRKTPRWPGRVSSAGPRYQGPEDVPAVGRRRAHHLDRVGHHRATGANPRQATAALGVRFMPDDRGPSLPGPAAMQSRPWRGRPSYAQLLPEHAGKAATRAGDESLRSSAARVAQAPIASLTGRSACMFKHRSRARRCSLMPR